MALPARRQKATVDTGRDRRDRCSAHLKFVRSYQCCVPGCQGMPIEAAHVRTGTDGGTGLKPSDCWVVSLCRDHHAEQHRIGETAFEAAYSISLKAIASEFAASSAPWKRYLAAKGARR